MPPVITVENLSKRYAISHHNQARQTTLRDALMNGARGFADKLRQPFSAARNDSTREEFWALKDVSFSVQHGDRLGIIGRNGAGKSTLLKILSRITEPTSGRVSIKGRVASLLEVGTGFHPELTGRENVYLNGAILGMSKAEIKKNFDEIVAFAEVEKFLDTPIKRYSSGMYVRLAFAVAAHLEPDILVVDEVLAVGDAQFQTKCLSKMSEIGSTGRTVLFVSHNTSAVENLCGSCCVLEEGKLAYAGDTASSIKYYFDRFRETARTTSLQDRHDRAGTGAVRIVSFHIEDSSGSPVVVLLTGNEYVFRFRFESQISRISDLDFGFTVRALTEQILFRNRTSECGIVLPSVFPQEGYIDCRIKRFPLTSGKYAFGFRLLVNGVVADYITGGHAAYFDVHNGDYFGTGKLTEFAPMVISHEWSIEDDHRKVQDGKS